MRKTEQVEYKFELETDKKKNIKVYIIYIFEYLLVEYLLIF